MNIVLNNRLPQIEKLLSHGNTLSVMGMPSLGISLFLRELSASNIGQSIYIDVFGLTELSALGLFQAIAQKLGIVAESKSLPELTTASVNALKKLTKDDKYTIIYFAGFDQLQPALDAGLLQSLSSLSRSSDGKVRLVFGLCISLKKLIPDRLFDSGLRLFGSIYYLKPYSDKELLYLLGLYGPENWQKSSKLNDVISLSGGHFQLLLQLLGNNSEISDSPNESMQLLFKNLYTHLLGPQRTIIRRIAGGIKNVEPDEYLLGIGMVRQTRSDIELFSSLFLQYLLGINNKHLPVKERRLYLILKRNFGRVVAKQAIIDTVWGDEIVSDWALNALVYRLRKHSVFVGQNYTIENHKKVGYELVKNV